MDEGLYCYSQFLKANLKTVERKKKKGQPLEPREFLAMLCDIVARENKVSYTEALRDISGRLLK